MLRVNSRGRFIPVAFLTSLLGAGFTSWSAWGNAIDLCFTAGCTIYQDTVIAGVSMWWIGAASFGLLALLAALGRPGLALFVSGVMLFVDCLLLLFLALTSPCVACLITGLFFALTYAAFRGAVPPGRTPPSRSLLLLLWSVLLIGNLLAVARSGTGTWPMQEAKDPHMNFYFSPSCEACREGIRAFSARRDVSFFPVPKNERDIALINAMNNAVARGASLNEALRQAAEAPVPGVLEYWSFSMLHLRFALVCNKAHALSAGGGALPFIEYLGLPQAGVFTPAPPPARKNVLPPPAAPDANLPVENAPPGVCADAAACP